QEKPVIPCDLREIFARVLGISTYSESVETCAEKISPMQRSLTLLVVEDNITNQVVIQSMLEKLGHDGRVAANGKEAIEVYRAHHHEFDIVLMDCEMPGMDGYEATRRIRAYEREHNLMSKMIVALTAHTLEEHIGACRAAGMDAHLAKPLSLERLREFLQTLCTQIGH
ncbi:MAG TPA: response regulator, partial [Spongiibacteraceae bacterium]|nr:response regulator [Spongiibacteraceae bacterium]